MKTDIAPTTPEQKWASLLSTIHASVMVRKKRWQSASMGPPTVWTGKRIEQLKANPELYALYQTHVHLAGRVAAHVVLNKSEPLAPLAMIDWPRPPWLRQRVIDIQADWSNQAHPGPDPEDEKCKRLGIPEAYWGAEVSDFAESDFKNGEWIYEDERPPRNLFLWGDNGCGKTYLACALAREWSARYIRAQDLLSAVRTSYSERDAEGRHAKLLHACREYPAIVLDDITSAHATEHNVAQVLDVIDDRCGRKQPTAVIAHTNLAGIAKLSRPLASRLLEFHVMRVVGKDRRAQQWR